MAKGKRVRADDLGKAIAEELTLYKDAVNDRIYEAGDKAIKNMVKITKATAPFNARATHKHYKSGITSKSEKDRLGRSTHTWYVRPPHHRLTHLLVHGHATKDGGRTKSDAFLHNACDQVFPEYENDVKEAVQGD